MAHGQCAALQPYGYGVGESQSGMTAGKLKVGAKKTYCSSLTLCSTLRCRTARSRLFLICAALSRGWALEVTARCSRRADSLRTFTL